jgi:hypothetical protein
MKPLEQFINLITGWFKAGWHLITVTITHGGQILHRMFLTISARHVRRWANESSYRRTLLAALTALAATFMPHPVAAAALGAAVAEWSPRRIDAYDYDDDDEPFPRRRLWDTYN